MNGAVCNDEVCVTCSDQLLEVIVTALSTDGTVVAITRDGVACEVATDLLGDVVPGEHLLTHGGVALQRGSLEAAR